jgi:hypothetical protein
MLCRSLLKIQSCFQPVEHYLRYHKGDITGRKIYISSDKSGEDITGSVEAIPRIGGIQVVYLYALRFGKPQVTVVNRPCRKK